MTRPKSLQMHVSDDLAARMRAAALRRDLSLDRVPPSGVGSDGSGTDRTRAFKLAL
jgi:hypothetical protein